MAKKRANEDLEEKEPLLWVSYDRLADGGRNFPERIKAKKVNPETEEILKKLFKI